MKALEFTSKINNNSIAIPAHLKNELGANSEKRVRVIVLIDDTELVESNMVREAEETYFLKGYNDVDAVYDDLEP